MQVRERSIKEIRELPPEDLMNIYEVVLDLKKPRGAPRPLRGEKPACLEVMEILKKCPGSLSEDIRQMREDRA